MTDREAMKMALEALEMHVLGFDGVRKMELAIESLEARLAQPDETETLKRCLFQMQEAAKALAQLDSTSDSATRSADSAESFCKQELHNLMSVAGRMALELECLLLDTKDLSVVSEWWDTGMESLQAYRDYIWSITHGKEEIIALAQPEQEPVAWATFDGEGNYDFMSYENNETYRDEYIKRNGKKYANWVKPLYTAPPKREWVGLTKLDIHVLKMNYDKVKVLHTDRAEDLTVLGQDVDVNGLINAIEAKLKEKNT